MIQKQISSVSHVLTRIFIESIQSLCNNGDKLTPEIIQTQQQEAFASIEAASIEAPKSISDTMHLKDYIIRSNLLYYNLALIRGCMDLAKWKLITQEMELLEYIAS